MKWVLAVVAFIIILGGAVFVARNRDNSIDTNTPPTDTTVPPAQGGVKTSYPSGNYNKSLKTADGLTRTYVVHLPTGYDAKKSYPLVLVLHGGFGSAANVEDQTGMSYLANIKGFIVAYPEGTTGSVGSSWNAGDCCGSAKNNIDDVSFIRQLVTSLKSNYSINSAKVFVTGMSNGAMLTNRLACEAADIFAGVAPVAGTLQIPSCNPVRMVPIIMVHGTDDPTVPFNGGAGTGTVTKNNTFIPVMQALADWATRNGCSSDSITTPVPPLVNDGKTIDKIEYTNCTAATLLYRINGGTHSWPSGNPGQRQEAAPPTQALNASKTIVEFFGL